MVKELFRKRYVLLLRSLTIEEMSKRIWWCRFLLATFAVLFLLGCATRPLVLNPRVKPLDFEPEKEYGCLLLIPFEDKTPKEERGTKRFREQPIDVFNDTLLNSLRICEIFKTVHRGTESKTADFQINGTLMSLRTDESDIKFGLIPSTMKVSATCISSFRFMNVKTGKVLLEETITTKGQGRTRIFGGGQYAQYDSTFGYEESISQAISENIAAITQHLQKIQSEMQ